MLLWGKDLNLCEVHFMILHATANAFRTAESLWRKWHRYKGIIMPHKGIIGPHKGIIAPHKRIIEPEYLHIEGPWTI